MKPFYFLWCRHGWRREGVGCAHGSAGAALRGTQRASHSHHFPSLRCQAAEQSLSHGSYHVYIFVYREDPPAAHLSLGCPGDYLLSSSEDSTLRVWNLREGQLFYTLQGHQGPARSTCFSPAGAILNGLQAGAALHRCSSFARHNTLSRLLVVLQERRSGLMDDFLLDSPLFSQRWAYVQDSDGLYQTKLFSYDASFTGDYFASGGDDEHVLVWRTNFDRPHVTPSAAPQTPAQGPASQSARRIAPQPVTAPKPPQPTAGRLALAKAGKSSQQRALTCELLPPACPEASGNGAADPVAATLQHVVGQLDVISSTMAIVEERLTLTEDRVRRMAAVSY